MEMWPGETLQTATHGTSIGAASKVIAAGCFTEALNMTESKRGVYCEGGHRRSLHCGLLNSELPSGRLGRLEFILSVFRVGSQPLSWNECSQTVGATCGFDYHCRNAHSLPPGHQVVLQRLCRLVYLLTLGV